MINDLKNAFINYMDSQFIKRDPELTFSLFSDNFTGFGTGEDEVAKSIEEFKTLYLRDYQQAPETIHVDYDFIETQYLTQDSGVVFSRFNIRTEINNQPLEMFGLRISGVFSRKVNDWKMDHMHVSLPNVEQIEDESYPIFELEEKNRELQLMVEKKTLELHDMNMKLTEQNEALQKALDDIDSLEDILPLCSYCKKIRKEDGAWENVDHYMQRRKIADVSHSICPDCVEENYPDFAEKRKKT